MITLRSIKVVVKGAAGTHAGWYLVSRTIRQPGVTVLMYHRITRKDDVFDGIDADAFRSQMLWIKKNCTAIGVNELESAVCWKRSKRPAVLITFDDGYRDYYENALPVLRELNMPAIVFLPTALMGTNELLWTDMVTWAVQRTRACSVNLPWLETAQFDLGDARRRDHLIETAKEALKAMVDGERRVKLAELLESLGVDGQIHETGRQMMNWDEVRSAMDVTYFGGHSHTHPIMSQLDNTQLENEIRQCREHLDRQLGIKSRAFAYPNGRVQDFDERAKRLLDAYGFDLAFSTIEGINGPSMDRLAVRRFAPYGDDVADLAWRIAGL